MLSPKNNHQLLQYKVAKIVRLIRKIRHTLQEEGLDHRQLPQLINQSLKLHELPSSSQSCTSSVFEEFAVNSLTENSNKFAASTLLALSETYKNLLNSLDDQSSFLDLGKITSTKQSPVKMQQIFPSNQLKRERSSVVKIQQGVEIQNENTYENREKQLHRIKKELNRKRKQMKMLKAQISRKNQVQQLHRNSKKKDRKSKRKQ